MYSSMSDFETIKKLGKGSYGTVFLVEAKDTNIKYALKRTKINEDRYDFDKELAVQKRLTGKTDEHITKALFSFEKGGYGYVGLEFVKGGDVYSGDCRNSNKDNTMRILRGTAQGLKFLHDNGIVHCDIKQENILCNSTNVKITDFGLATVLKKGAKMTRESTIGKGTGHFRAPEVVYPKDKKNVISFATDVWAFGVLAYEMFFKKRPFTGNKKDKKKLTSMTYKMPAGSSPELVDLFSRIFTEWNKRITMAEILAHPVFTSKSFRRPKVPSKKSRKGPEGKAVKPAKVKPAKVKPAKVKPAKVKPAKVKPAKVKPAKKAPAKPSRAKGKSVRFSDEIDDLVSWLDTHKVTRKNLHKLIEMVRELKRSPSRSGSKSGSRSGSKSSKSKECPKGQEVNPKTKKCSRKCTKGNVRNPNSGRCIKINGLVYKKVIEKK
jgi:serine/threonine protein kinase